jgi:hypothetical protein
MANPNIYDNTYKKVYFIVEFNFPYTFNSEEVVHLLDNLKLALKKLSLNYIQNGKNKMGTIRNWLGVSEVVQSENLLDLIYSKYTLEEITEFYDDKSEVSSRDIQSQ